MLRSSSQAAKEDKEDPSLEAAHEASPAWPPQGKSTRMPCLYLNHGGGPMPLLGQQPEVANFCSKYAATLPAKPSAIVVVTAHWEERITTVCSGANPPLFFDYGGFPPESYKYKYPAPGSPTLAEHIQGLLRQAGLKVAADPRRGWDHGVFVPLMLMFPKAEVPIISVSLLANQDAAQHIAVGEALRPLRDQGVLIVGSGASFHNFKYFFASGEVRNKGVMHSRDFDSYLRKAAAGDSSYATRKEALARWERAPGALEAHPRGGAEHLMPLFVIFGAGGEDAKVKTSPEEQSTSGLAVSAFEFF